ncbi:hypothetical protein CCACVL1_03678 [Corchorus capsularis]|uniref:Uncharacterized protein n=1 Tax=Corchorus capsularis TaxID=210143 RepID=A0A1R3JXZ9_COCAP|nr:hypothetical protein CCACVL1_03678 [Corchorus capsularis]
MRHPPLRQLLWVSTFQSGKPDIYSGQTLPDSDSAALFLARPAPFAPFHTEPSSRANCTVATPFFALDLCLYSRKLANEVAYKKYCSWLNKSGKHMITFDWLNWQGKILRKKIITKRQIDIVTCHAWLSVAKISLQTSFPSEYTCLTLLQTDSGKKVPETILVQEEDPYSQNIVFVGCLGIGFACFLIASVACASSRRVHESMITGLACSCNIPEISTYVACTARL